MNFTQLFFVTERYSTDKYPIYNYLFRFTDVEPVFADIIRKWYNESNQLAPIRQHLIGYGENTRRFFAENTNSTLLFPLLLQNLLN
jgi:hypothetical protein